MFKKLTLGVIALSVSSLFVSVANAATVVVDDATFGADTVVRDKDNNQEFLRLDLTMGYGFAGIVAELGAGGDFEGWSVASEAQMLALGVSSGISHGSQDAGEVTLANALRDWFCPAGTCVNLSSTHEVARGLIADLQVINLMGDMAQVAFTIGRQFNVSPDAVDFRTSGFEHNGTNEEIWLTRVAPVPVPAAGLLLLGGLFGLGVAGRRRKTA